ncbi:Dyp-type peroxidase [Geodermatophilus sp. URMC 61]|uniref:Dyp-type peroxidase n=1 Tax=Geodermatophilus sp. URMC 61 TaxID=3423411 RepID=UPI00406BF054
MARTRSTAPLQADRSAPAPAALLPAPRGGHAVDHADVQGLVGSGYRCLPEAVFLGLRVDDGAAGRAFLTQLLPLVTSMAADHSSRALNVALNHGGLAQLGLTQAALDGFSPAFAGGMADPIRSAFLGDVGTHAPSTWSWGGPDNPRVDVLLLLYAATDTELTAHARDVRRLLPAEEVVALPTTTLSPRDHLGFADGISQPAVAGLHGRGERGVALGEFLLGYPNGYGRRTSRPLLPAADDPRRVLPPAPRAEAPGSVDLGRNGTYLVVRTLAVDVAAFRDHVDRWAERTGLRAEQVAAKMVGRWPDGTSLTVSPDRPLGDEPVDNDFRYTRDGDAAGLGCPIAAHVRRANPRDSLDPRPGSEASIRVNDRHRLIRRGRQYGPLSDGECGLHFICLNANLSRQFEFVQHSWLNNPAFAGLQDSPDPIAGYHPPDGGVFPMPADPVRRRLLDLPRFVRLRGGGYFFLPGIRALHHLAYGPPADGRDPR